MFKKKIALLSLVSIISNFSLFTTNVLAYEIKENSKKIASTEVIKKDSSKNKKTTWVKEGWEKIDKLDLKKFIFSLLLTKIRARSILALRSRK